VVDYVRGDSRRGSTPNIMADIYHSNPTALAPLNSSSPSLLTINEVYGKWLKSVINTGPDGHYGAEGRPGIVFVGTNDGVLHAFNLDDWYDRSRNFHKGGEELWGFVPPSLFGKMASLLGGHQFMFDGTPIVQDVLLQKLPTGTPIFRTMLLAAVRGEPSFVALDVTQPEDPIFMWQSSFPNLGNTIANPALAQVNVKWNTTVQHRAVAILPGGEGAQLASCPTAGRALVDGVTRATYPVGNTRNVRCWKDLGRSLYVVDVATGQLIQEFGPEHFPSPLTGSVVMDGNAIDGTSAAYFFDHDGVLWRLSMLHSDPREWRVVPIYDMFASPLITDPSTTRSWQVGRRPTFAPSLTHDRYGNLVITAGTGDVDSPIDTARQRVVSLTEYRNAGLSTNDEITASIQLNWQIDLAVNEAVTGPLTVFDDQVYWGTFESQASSNQCALGVSRIYGAHAYLNDSTTTVVSLAPKPVLVSSTAQPTDPPVLSEVFDPSGTNLLIGLTVKRQPVCQTSARLINSATSQSVPASPPGGGTYTLSGVLAGDSHGGELKGNNAQIKELPVGKPLKTTIHTSVSSWATYAD
jgi:hypothetical protein